MSKEERTTQDLICRLEFLILIVPLLTTLNQSHEAPFEPELYGLEQHARSQLAPRS